MSYPTRATTAVDLATQARDLLAAAGLDAWATTNAAHAPTALGGGSVVVVVNPPTVHFETWTETMAEWPVWLIAGPATDTDAAWDALDTALAALVMPLEVALATPNTFTDAQGTAWPALVLNVVTDHLTP